MLYFLTKDLQATAFAFYVFTAILKIENWKDFEKVFCAKLLAKLACIPFLKRYMSPVTCINFFFLEIWANG